MRRIARFAFGEAERELECGDDARRFRDAHALSFCELSASHCARRTSLRAADRARARWRSSRDAGAEQDRQQFGVRKALGSVLQHPLAGTLVHRHVSDQFVHAESLGAVTRIRVKLYRSGKTGRREHRSCAFGYRV